MGVNMQFLASVHGCAAQAAVDGWRKRQIRPRRISNGDRKKNKNRRGCRQTEEERCRSVWRTDGGMHMTLAKCIDNGRKRANGARLRLLSWSC